MNSKKEYIWYTGDWKQYNNPEPPYNGVQIKAKAIYTLPTNPPTTQKLVSVAIEVVDYTNDTNGISSALILYKTGIWYDIPIPKITTESASQPNSDFTVLGIDNVGLGKLQLDSSPIGIYLNIQCRYGDPSREEIGYIMKIEEIYNEEQDPIIVSG